MLDLIRNPNKTILSLNELNGELAKMILERHNLLPRTAVLHHQEERLDEADKQFYITVGYLLAIFQHAERLFEVAEIDEKRQIIGLILSNLQLDDKKTLFQSKRAIRNCAFARKWFFMAERVGLEPFRSLSRLYQLPVS